MALATRRLQSELKAFLREPPEGCQLEHYEPLNCWQIALEGPQCPGGRFYEGQVFRLRVRFSDGYPLTPPEIIFLAPPPVHPHVYSNGHICLSILYDGSTAGYSPALTVAKIMLSIRSMLASNLEYRRPEGDLDYCRRSAGRSPMDTRWEFHDDAA